MKNTGKYKIDYYKEGVRVKFPTKNAPLRFQILPAYNSMNPKDAQGFMPCLVDGKPTAWFGLIQAARFVGHGERSSRVSILSLNSFEGQPDCPYRRLVEYCKKSADRDWRYLVKNDPDGVLQPIRRILIMNVVDIDAVDEGVQIGEFSYSIARALLDMESGLVFRPEEQVGDVTAPIDGPIMVANLPITEFGTPAGGYEINVDEENGQIARRSISVAELESRYHLDDPESFMRIPTGQEIVDSLVSVLKGHKNAKGIDETYALKEAVGDTYQVGTVAAPGAVHVIGWNSAGGEKSQERARGLIKESTIERVQDSQQKGGGATMKEDGTNGEGAAIGGRGVATRGGRRNKLWDEDELRFLEDFSLAVKKCGFVYSDRDIVRLHTSVKCGRMTVLGGAPGVGKSSIVEMYSRCAGGENSSYCPIAVSPSWAEPSDILGDEDLTGAFKDARCGLASFIRRAKGRGELCAICFEEMNLACVEHYFSDLMQAVAKPVDDTVDILGYDRAGLPNADSQQETPSAPLQMSPNVRIFGTCNFDITTHPFSARFYDRCSYIELSSSMRGFPEEDVRINLEQLKYISSPKTKIWAWKYPEDRVSSNVAATFNQMQKLLENTWLYPSPRVLKQMRAYVVSRPPLGKEERGMPDDELQLRALDESLAQYVLSKYTPALNLRIRDEQKKLRDEIQALKFEVSSFLLSEIEKRLNGLSVE